MSFLDWFGSPYSAFAHNLRGNDHGLLQRAKYRIVPGPNGLSMAQLDLSFGRAVTPVANPHMNLAVILDRSGSMAETFAEGHAYDVCSQVLTQVRRAGLGFELTFYNSTPTHAGYVDSDSKLKHAIARNQPEGGTSVTQAIKEAIARNRPSKKGLYMIVITDGEFSDKDQVERYISNELLDKITPTNPYAFRLHFVGAGHHVDHEFLHKMEDLATGKGVPLVAAHHHAHLRHAHEDVLDELDGAFLGAGLELLVGDYEHVAKGKQASSQPVIQRISDLSMRNWHEGDVASFDFLPKQVSLGLELSHVHAEKLHVGFKLHNSQHDKVLLDWQVSLPRTGGPSKGGWLRNLVHGLVPALAPVDPAEAARREAAAADESNRQAVDLRELARGGIPLMAQRRLQELGQTGDEEGAIFTSNLTPDELALLRRNGYRPRGLVMGSAMYHVGQAYASATNDCEVKVLSEAYNEATRLAVSRLEQELRLIGAHGVVGVRLAMARHEWGEKTVEVQIMGTAISGPGPAPQKPWMSDLSGQEWYALHRAGYDPVALVWGHCTWFCLTTLQDETIERGFFNQELAHWSQAMTKARNLAQAHVLEQARALGAHAVTGMHIERKLSEVRLTGGDGGVYEREHHNLVLSITGTAIRARPGTSLKVPETRLVLSLADGKLRSEHMASTSVGMLAEEL